MMLAAWMGARRDMQNKPKTKAIGKKKWKQQIISSWYQMLQEFHPTVIWLSGLHVLLIFPKCYIIYKITDVSSTNLSASPGQIFYSVFFVNQYKQI